MLLVACDNFQVNLKNHSLFSITTVSYFRTHCTLICREIVAKVQTVLERLGKEGNHDLLIKSLYSPTSSLVLKMKHLCAVDRFAGTL